MPDKDLLENIKKLREMTGVGFKDCKLALDETSGNIEKSIEFLRKKGIAKASKKMSRTASEGLALVKEEDGQISIIEINSETDFVAKNQDFINFCKEISNLNFLTKGNLKKLNETQMSNGNLVKENLVNLIACVAKSSPMALDFTVHKFENQHAAVFIPIPNSDNPVCFFGLIAA